MILATRERTRIIYAGGWMAPVGVAMIAAMGQVTRQICKCVTKLGI